MTPFAIFVAVMTALFTGAFAVGWLRERPARAKRARPDDLSDADVSRLRSRIRRSARHTMLMIPAKSPGFSKVGGLPELPDGVAWPKGERAPPAFVAQIDIAAFRAHGGFDWLPEAGRLYLFFDDDRNGAADCGELIYARSPPGPEASAPSALPKARYFLERRVGFMRFTSFPSEDWLEDAWPNLDWGDLAKEADFGDETEHRIGGYPSEIQGGQMRIECEHLWRDLTQDYKAAVPEPIRIAARQWRLLLQIDTDPALNMNWWDGGRLYVFIRARDAKRGDFSKTVTITQTH